MLTITTNAYGSIEQHACMYNFLIFNIYNHTIALSQFFKLAQIPYMFGTSSALPAAEGGQVYLAIGINAPDSIMGK